MVIRPGAQAPGFFKGEEMKTKKNIKKLNLNKITVASCDRGCDEHEVNGGTVCSIACSSIETVKWCTFEY